MRRQGAWDRGGMAMKEKRKHRKTAEGKKESSTKHGRKAKKLALTAVTAGLHYLIYREDNSGEKRI